MPVKNARSTFLIKQLIIGFNCFKTQTKNGIEVFTEKKAKT